MAFKMRSNPMQRNFGVGGPMNKNKNGKPSNVDEFLKDMSDNRYKPGAGPNIGVSTEPSKTKTSKGKGKKSDEIPYHDPHHGRL
jgi:hypothetical protein